MQIRPVDDKNQWENYILGYSPNSILQSWNWGEFAASLGRKVFRVGLFDRGQLLGTALVVKITSKRANYLETHGGPLIDWADHQQFHIVLSYLKKLAKEEGCHFLRLRPPMLYSENNVERLKGHGFVLAPMYFQAEHTQHLDLSRSEEELLKNMRKNTRYGVRRAEREGVKVDVKSRDLDPKGLESALQSFFGLYEQTVSRQDFVPYDLGYFKDEVNAFWEENQAAVFVAQYNNKPVASAIVLFYGGMAYYHHAASLHTDPDVYAPHAVMWAVIKEAKSRGIKKLDFWGVAPSHGLSSEGYKVDKGHPRAGLSFFKQGFGGEYVRWMHTMDLPLTIRYWPMYAYVKWERWRRKL